MAVVRKVRIARVLMLTQGNDVLMRRIDVRIDLVLSFCQIVEPVPQVPAQPLVFPDGVIDVLSEYTHLEP